MFAKRAIYLSIIVLFTLISFIWTFWIFKVPTNYDAILIVAVVRAVFSILIFNDSTALWSRASSQNFLSKAAIFGAAFVVYMPYFYTEIRISLMFSEALFFLFSINLLIFSYRFYNENSGSEKNGSLLIFGAGGAGSRVLQEVRSSYKVLYFVDDNQRLQQRSIDGVKIISQKLCLDKFANNPVDVLIVAIPSRVHEEIHKIYDNLSICARLIKVLPSENDIFQNSSYINQAHKLNVEDLLARHPNDLDTSRISAFIEDKVICITGAGGSIGSELATQCSKFGAKKIILLDHSEFNLYQIEQELNNFNIVPILVSVVDRKSLDQVFSKYSPNIVIHAAAYKHVPMVELNIAQSIVNNIVGTKNVIDVSIDNHIENIIVVSTDKAVRPTSIMGATKRVCELYAQNVNSGKTRISVVRFGNVLGSSGSVIPLFKKQIKMGGPITITHPDITRYFMLISEACELVLQSGSIGKGGEVFVLNMGEPIKITDLAQTMVKLSGVNNIEFKYTGLRPGEKLHEELLHCDSDIITKYESITISASEEVPIDYLNNQIDNLLNSKSQARDLKKIVPEFNHQLN